MAITTTTLSGAVTNLDTTIGLTSVTGVTAGNGQTGAGITWLLIDQEFFLVAASPAGTAVPVVRGYNSSASQPHVNGALVLIGLPGDFSPNIYYGLQAMFAKQILGRSVQEGINLIGATDAIDATSPGFYVVKTAGVDAMTLAVPPASAEGNIIEVISDTTNAHTLTAPSAIIASGLALKTIITFPAFRGAYVKLRACNGVWQVLSTGGSAGVVVLS
jgi:hypothetical protein